MTALTLRLPSRAFPSRAIERLAGVFCGGAGGVGGGGGGEGQICLETVSQGKTSSGQGCNIGRSTLKPTGSSLASVKVKYWRIAFGHGVKVRSPDIFGGGRVGVGGKEP